MSILQTHGRPGVGILVLQHQEYDKQGLDLIQRAGQHCIRVLGRMDKEDGLGHWLEDVDSRSDLMGANFWKADYAQRPISGCAFAWPAEISTQGSKNVATGGPAGAPPQGQKLQGNAQAIPKGSGGGGDGRFIPKNVIIPFRTGKPGQDPQAAARAQQAQGGAQDPNQADTGGPVLFLGIGASATAQGFGGQGVGTGSGFPKFQGVRTNFSSGSRKAGATFSP